MNGSRQIDETHKENREFLSQFSTSAAVSFAFMAYFRLDTMSFAETWLVSARGQPMDNESEFIKSLEKRIARYLKVNQLLANASGLQSMQKEKSRWIHSGDECIGIGEATGNLVPIISFPRGDDDAPERQAIFKMGLTYVVQALNRHLFMNSDWSDGIFKTAMPFLSVEFVVLNKRGEVVHEARGNGAWHDASADAKSAISEQLSSIKQLGKNDFLDAVTAATSREKKTTLVPIIGEAGSPRWVLVSPFEGAEPDHALVIFDGDRTDHNWLLDQMFDIYKLTPSERKVARGIVFGQTVSEIAEDADLSVATVRSYVKQVLSKMGLHRQSELIQLYHASKLPISKSTVVQGSQRNLL